MDLSQSKIPVPVLAAILAIVAAIAIFVSLQFVPKEVGGARPAVTSEASANETFFKQKAQECQGDLSKLSPQDQQEVIKRAGGMQYAFQIMKSSYAPQTK